VTVESGDTFDPDRILAELDAGGVEYLLVGGLAARAFGAQRRTMDVDCVPNTTAVSNVSLGRCDASTLGCESVG
jgi:hypothetical protein